MKKSNFVILAVCLMTALLLTACAMLLPEAPTEKEREKPLVEQIDEALAGTWISHDSDRVWSKWTFHDGKYVLDVYVDGEKLDNSTVGSYSIGSDAIHTVTEDQKNNVEGSIPFTFEDGELTLNGANGPLEKE